VISSPSTLLQEIVRALSSELVLPAPAVVRLIYRRQVVDQARAARAIAEGYEVQVIATAPGGDELVRIGVSARWAR
jgi:hypothetical protein